MVGATRSGSHARCRAGSRAARAIQSVSTRVLCAIALGTCFGSARADGLLLVAAEYVETRRNVKGQRASVDWIDRRDSGSVLTYGVSRFEMDDTSWSLARISAYRPLSHDIRMDFALAAGPGQTAGERYTYQKAELGIELPLVDHWRLGFRDSYLNIHPTRGHLLTTNLRYQPENDWSIAFSLNESIAGNLQASAASVRFDRFAAVHWFAGVVRGSTNDTRLLDVADLTPAETAGDRYWQYFLGANLSIGPATLTIAADVLGQGQERRRAVNVAIKLPIGNRE